MEDNDTENFIKTFSFSMLEGKLDKRIVKSIASLGFINPTEIQARTLPYLLKGHNLIGAAKTGSGKTLAFLIPILDNLLKYNFNATLGTGCVILSPTRELALQTFELVKKLTCDTDLTYALIVGGENKCKETKVLSKGINIIVSTPGRLLDHLINTKFNCKNMKCLVVDEADKLLEAGFEKHISGIIKKLPKTRQTILFSATIDNRVKNLARLAMNSSPIIITIKNEETSTVQGLQQGYYLCPIEEKLSWLFKMLKKTKKQKVMVFFSTCKLVDFYFEFFNNHCGASIIKIHGKESQTKRKLAFHSFVNSKAGTLFCTDIAARGLDIPSVDWIIQYDPPTDAKEYIHRVGRTARGTSNTGNAVILLRPEELSFVEFLESNKVYLDKYTFDKIPTQVQTMLTNLINTNGLFKTLARKAYISYLRNYKKHNLKNIFNVKTLDIKATGKAFGFLDPPHVDMRTL